MKSPWIKRWIVMGAVALAGLYVFERARAQEPANDQTEADMEIEAEMKQFQLLQAKRSVAEAARALAEEHKKMGQEMERFHWAPSSTSALRSTSSLREAAEALRDAEGDDAKEDAEAKLRELLSDYFDADMDLRASELEKIEKRVSHLREQLERRGNHKPDIIDLQVKVLVNEAEGLGFFSDSESTGFIFSPMGERLRIMGPEMGMRFDSPRAALPTPTPAPPAAPAQVIEPARPLNGEAPR